MLVRVGAGQGRRCPSSSGSAAVKASSASWLALRLATVSPVWARPRCPRATWAKLAGRSPFMRRVNSAASSGRLAVGGKAVVPGGFGLLAAGLGVPAGVHLRGWRRAMRPAQGFAGELDFFGAQRLAVGLGGVGAVGPLPMRVLQMTSGLAGSFLVSAMAARHLAASWPSTGDHVPARLGTKRWGGVVGKPGRHLAVDGDAVVVVQGDQLVQLPGAGRGGDGPWLMPSIRQPSPRKRRCGGRRCGGLRLNSAASSFSASAKPHGVGMPWPSGPVVVSTPG